MYICHMHFYHIVICPFLKWALQQSCKESFNILFWLFKAPFLAKTSAMSFPFQSISLEMISVVIVLYKKKFSCAVPMCSSLLYHHTFHPQVQWGHWSEVLSMTVVSLLSCSVMPSMTLPTKPPNYDNICTINHCAAATDSSVVSNWLQIILDGGFTW